MAIYRTGTASLNAQGVIVGVGTNWQDKLSLVRVGATMIFQTAPLTICTISSIVSPTEMRATATDGAVVAAGTKYVILLHDSITVDGLAQDVAETLRYYQSKETVIEDAIEFFQNFDWERIVAVGNQVKADAQTASTAATNAKTSETNSKASENAAKASQTAAAASQTAAKTSETNAKASETAAGTSRTAAASSATAAAGSASAASGSATAAKTSETNAKTSETNANSSKVAAAASQTAAAGSASAASGSATAAKTSETNAKTSETNAASSKTAAAASATTATQQADRAKTEADRAASANPDNQLKKANNLSDVANVNTARTNIKVDKLVQGADRTLIQSQNGSYSLMIHNTGLWGAYSEIDSQYVALAIGQGGTGGKTALDARNNLELGVGNSPTFQNLYLNNALEIRRNSDDSAPSGSLVARRSRADGTTIVTSENRANANGSVEWIKRDGAGVPRTIAITEENYVTFNSLTPAPANIEVGIKNPNAASYVDFHYSAKYDYDARIVCDGMNSDQRGGGNLRFYAGYNQISSVGSTNITGGRLLVNTSDVVFDTQVGLAAGSIQIPRTADATTPIGAGLRGIHAGVDSANFNNASNINLYSWFGIGFCTAYTSPTNGVIQGKPAVYINTRDGTINAKGAVQANGVTLTSDWNAKENISIIDPDEAMEMMIKLDGWRFRYKESESDRMTAGIIAQDLDLVIPDLVIKPEATPEVDVDGNVIIDDETGKPVNDGDSNLTADYMGLIGYMVAAIKGAGVKNAALQGEVDEMKKEIEELKALVAALVAK